MSSKSCVEYAIHATRARRVLLAIVGGAVLSLAAAGASVASETAGEWLAPQVTVSLAGLDLASQKDARSAYSQLQHAARSVCRELENRDPRGLRQYENCYNRALSNAVAAVDNRNLTALHRSDSNIRIARREADAHAGS
ncbi:MAG TPA: UrcA family protein [Povalibacter sp.]|nr:UrcA family protein [Povalibacter sp.]